MASKRGSDDDLEGPASKMARRDDDDDGSKSGGRSGRIRKKSAKVLEMEEFEEIEKKQFTKKTDPKGKSIVTPPGPKKGKVKAGVDETATPKVVPTQQGEGFPAGFVLVGGAVAQEAVPTSPVKASTKQAIGAKVKEGQGQGSVIKLLLSTPTIPASPAVSTNVISKTSVSTIPSPSVAVATPPTPAAAKRVKIKAEQQNLSHKTELMVKQEQVVSTGVLMTQDDITDPVSIKGELMDPQAAHMMLASSLQGQNDPMLSSSTAAPMKSEPGLMMSSSDTLTSLKLKLMMSPKDTQPLDSIISTAPVTHLFNPDETDGVSKAAPPGTGKKKAAPRKKKTPGEKGGKATAVAKSAAEQMPNLAALVSTPKAVPKVVKEERSLSLSDAMDTSLSDASLDMSSIVESALDMEEEAALVIAEGAVAGTSKPKKKKAGGAAGGKKKKAKAADMDPAGFDSDEAMSAPPEGEIGALAAKAQRASSGKKKVPKKSLESFQDLQDKKKRPSRRAPTAYMLYCNAQRPKVVAESPGIDFAQISRTLGIMWQCLSKKEKMMWRRKSKKMAGKGSTLISTGKMGSKKGADPAALAAATLTAAATASTAAAATHPPVRVPGASKTHRAHAASASPAAAGDDTPHSPIKGFGIEPIDIAAHLKLLGESLSIIGNRLQEHKGLIAVQGSLSVLLDSMLCACGPLLALTHQVPGLDGCSEATHARTLDMVAYIMPGL